MLVKDLLKAGLIASVVSCVAVADEVVSVEADNDAQSYSTQTTDSKFLREKNENIDVARELTITKSSSDAYYKLPRLPQYTPKPLIDDAKGIAVVNGVPLNCKLLGEAEGIDSSDGKAAPSFELIREGALNDLRNGTMDLVDSRDRIVLTPVKEAMTCEIRNEGDQFDEKDCTTWTQIPSNGKILYYRIHANVFDCGAR
ncbi:hypothetical protein [Helicobacter trogontum]|uniref:Uncharacterized protein n=1 Tax=Helicobacter trogontum TaxID=50960 RepID=A0ABQ0D4M8_9HELI|nr:hypothetical protein [Helicobacter trogontum]MCI5786890.1 DUF4156 domain-containing protein [Helicobacter trogontum]MDY5185635.1 hypothetical protein [Helicobacter trogontum]